jgi:hypothetical protein
MSVRPPLYDIKNTLTSRAGTPVCKLREIFEAGVKLENQTKEQAANTIAALLPRNKVVRYSFLPTNTRENLVATLNSLLPPARPIKVVSEKATPQADNLAPRSAAGENTLPINASGKFGLGDLLLENSTTIYHQISDANQHYVSINLDKGYIEFKAGIHTVNDDGLYEIESQLYFLKSGSLHPITDNGIYKKVEGLGENGEAEYYVLEKSKPVNNNTLDIGVAEGAEQVRKVELDKTTSHKVNQKLSIPIYAPNDTAALKKVLNEKNIILLDTDVIDLLCFLKYKHLQRISEEEFKPIQDKVFARSETKISLTDLEDIVEKDVVKSHMIQGEYGSKIGDIPDKDQRVIDALITDMESTFESIKGFKKETFYEGTTKYGVLKAYLDMQINNPKMTTEAFVKFINNGRELFRSLSKSKNSVESAVNYMRNNNLSKDDVFLSIQWFSETLKGRDSFERGSMEIDGGHPFNSNFLIFMEVCLQAEPRDSTHFKGRDAVRLSKSKVPKRDFFRRNGLGYDIKDESRRKESTYAMGNGLYVPVFNNKEDLQIAKCIRHFLKSKEFKKMDEATNFYDAFKQFMVTDKKYKQRLGGVQLNALLEKYQSKLEALPIINMKQARQNAKSDLMALVRIAGRLELDMTLGLKHEMYGLQKVSHKVHHRKMSKIPGLKSVMPQHKLDKQMRKDEGAKLALDADGKRIKLKSKEHLSALKSIEVPHGNDQRSVVDVILTDMLTLAHSLDLKEFSVGIKPRMKDGGKEGVVKEDGKMVAYTVLLNKIAEKLLVDYGLSDLSEFKYLDFSNSPINGDSVKLFLEIQNALQEVFPGDQKGVSREGNEVKVKFNFSPVSPS